MRTGGAQRRGAVAKPMELATLVEVMDFFVAIKGVMNLPDILRVLKAHNAEGHVMSMDGTGSGRAVYLGEMGRVLFKGPVMTAHHGCDLILLAIAASYARPSAMAAGSALRVAALNVPISGARPRLLGMWAHSAPVRTAVPMPRTPGVFMAARKGDQRRSGLAANARIGNSSCNGCAVAPATVAERRRILRKRIGVAANEEKGRGVPALPRAKPPEARLVIPRALADCSLPTAALAPPSTTREFEGGAARLGALLRPPPGGSAEAPMGRQLQFGGPLRGLGRRFDWTRCRKVLGAVPGAERCRRLGMGALGQRSAAGLCADAWAPVAL